MKCYYPLFLLLLLASCASLTHQRVYTLPVRASKQDVTLKHGNTVYKLPAKIELRHSNKPVSFAIQGSDSVRNITIYPSLSPRFVRGNILLYPPFGYLVDLTNHARFYYGKTLLIDMEDTSSNICTGYPAFYKEHLKKGSWSIVASLPYVNNFYKQPKNEGVKQNTGFFGSLVGIEYAYKDDRFLQLSGAGCLDFLLPFPAPVHYDSGEVEQMAASYLALTNNVNWHGFTFGYGAQITQSVWRYTYYGNDDYRQRPDVSKRGLALGFATNAYWKLGNCFNLGIIYNPSIYSLTQGKFLYEHLISLDFRWRIPLQYTPPPKGHYSTL
jgi:hypothetical protein